MDLMTLAAKIVLDDSEYTKGVANAEKTGNNLAKKMSAMTVAVGNIAADMIKKGASAIGGVMKSAIGGYAEYQQLIGGVEKLFGQSADKVSAYAKKAFKTAGMSANQYMDTVTGFSATLLQGLGGDTEKAADIANTAIQDMADNANTYGTDISSIQAAYQGFAKQNYTMLDNLKLGYGGTRGEMVRLINDSGILENEIKDLDGVTFDQIIAAIHEVQKELNITGTTANEAAGTISGSKASLQAAWVDFLTSVGGEADQAKLKEAGGVFKTTFETYVKENLLPSITTTMENAPELIDTLADAITSLPQKAMAKLAESGVNILTSGVEGVADVATWLLDGIIGIFDAAANNEIDLTRMGTAIGDFIGTSITKIVTNLDSIVSGALALGKSLAEGIVDGLKKGFFGEEDEIDAIGEAMNESIAKANVDEAKVNALLKYIGEIGEKYGSAAKQTSEFKNAQDDLAQYLGDAAYTVFANFGNDIDGAINKLSELNQAIRMSRILQAMDSARAEYDIQLGKKEGDLAVSRYKQEYNQKIVDELPQTLIENIQRYAGEMLRLNTAAGGTVGYSGAYIQGKGFLNENEFQLYSMLQKGLDRTTGEELKEQDNETLMKLFNETFDALLKEYKLEGKSEQEHLWNESRTDRLYSKEEVSGIGQQAREAQRVVDEEVKTQETLTKEINKLNDETMYINAAFNQTAEEVSTATGLTVDALLKGGTALYGAFENISQQLAGFTFGFGNGSGTGEATGIDSVPYNGFRASLHKGEMILTKKEAENFRNGGGSAEIVLAIQSLQADMQNLKIVVGQKTFGRAVVEYGGRRTRDYIGDTESRYSSGYGT